MDTGHWQLREKTYFCTLRLPDESVCGATLKYGHYMEHFSKTHASQTYEDGALLFANTGQPMTQLNQFHKYMSHDDANLNGLQ